MSCLKGSSLQNVQFMVQSQANTNAEDPIAQRMITKFEKATENYEKAIVKLRENLQYLANEGKVADRFITMQNLTLKSLTEFQKQVELYISHLELENLELTLKISKEYQRQASHKESLEAICIIHGILDFPAWIAKGKNYLVAEAVDFYHQGMIQIPDSLHNLINELSEEERNTIFDLLYKKRNLKLDQEYQELLTKVKGQQHA